MQQQQQQQLQSIQPTFSNQQAPLQKGISSSQTPRRIQDKGVGAKRYVKQERGNSLLFNSSSASLMWKEKLKIKEKEAENLKSYDKDELGNVEVITLPHENLEVQRVAKISVEKKLLADCQNDIEFYKIPSYDRKRAKQRNNTNFRTQHQISDKALLGECKLFQESKLSPFEVQIRQSLKKKDPNNILFLGEIYKKLEDSLEDQTNRQSNQVKDRSQQQNDVKLVEGLDYWMKQQRTFLQEKLEKERNKSENNNPNRQMSQRTNSLQRKETISRMSATLPQLNKESSTSLILSQYEQSQKFPHLVGMLKEQSPFTGILKKKNTLPAANEVYHQDHLEEIKPLDKRSSMSGTPQNTGNNMPKARFFDALHEALKTINEKEKEKSSESSSIMFDKNRGLRKSIKNYMKKVPDMSEQYSKLKGEDVTNQEFTHEGMRETIQDLFKVDDEEGLSSVIDRARFYEKQAGLIEAQLIQKIRDTIQLINNKVNTARILRLENYQLLRKISQLKILIKQLQEELLEQQNKTSKGQKYDQFDGQGLAQKKKIVTIQAQNDGNSNSNQLQSSQQSEIKNSSNVSSTNNNNRYIESLMNNVQRANELDSEISALKSTLSQHELKIIENNSSIITIEDNIRSKKKELKTLQKGKKIFLLELLKNGKDARSEGLSWIIRSIWNGQEKVYDSYLPDFLDQKGKEYLLMRSQKEDELQNMVSLLNMQLELYKANLMINDHMKDIEGLQIEDDSNLVQEAIHQPNSMAQDQHYNSQNIINNNNMNNNNNNSTNINTNSQSIFSFNNAQVVNLVANLSKIDVKKVRQEQVQQKKREKSENINSLIEGIDPSQQNIVQKTLNELSTSKHTSNDIIYIQTQKKIKEVVRQVRKSNQQFIKDKEKHDNESITLLNANQSIISSDDQKAQNMSISHNNINSAIQNNTKNPLFEANNVINKYESREEFVKQYEQLCHKIEEKNKQIKIIEEEELMRIIREFDYKNYRKRMGVACSVVLCSLFGCYKADKELIRHGMTRK